MANDPKFKAEVIKRFKEHQTEIFMGGGLQPNLKSTCTYFKPYHFKNDELVWGSLITNRTPYDDCWLIRSYPVKDGQPESFLVY